MDLLHVNRTVALALLFVLAASGCDRGVAGVPEAPDLQRVITATTAVEGITFTAVATVAGAEVTRAGGVLDLGTGEGYREDAALGAGGAVEPVAEVWLADGVQYQRELGQEDTRVINGSTGSFLVITTAPDAPTLEEALRRTFEGRGWEAVAPEEIHGEEAGTRIAAEPTDEDQRRVEVVVDNADVIRELRVPGTREAVESAVVITFAPGPVEVPALPE